MVDDARPPTTFEPVLLAPACTPTSLSEDATALYEARGRHDHLAFDFFEEGAIAPRRRRNIEEHLGPRAKAAIEELRVTGLGRAQVLRDGFWVTGYETDPAYAVTTADGPLEVVLSIASPPPWATDNSARRRFLAHLIGATMIVHDGVATITTNGPGPAHSIRLGNVSVHELGDDHQVATYYATWWDGVLRDQQGIGQTIADGLSGSRVLLEATPVRTIPDLESLDLDT